MDCALDLMRRLPPQQIEKNLSDLIDLVPSLCEDLLSSVDQPLKIAKDKESGKDYLLCDYNRDGDSYRFVSNRHSEHSAIEKRKIIQYKHNKQYFVDLLGVILMIHH